MFKYHDIDMYNYTFSVCARKESGRPPSDRTENGKGISEIVRRNYVQMQKILSRKTKIAPRTTSCILLDDLGVGR